MELRCCKVDGRMWKGHGMVCEGDAMVFSIIAYLGALEQKIFLGPVLHCSKLEAIDQNKIFGLVLHCSTIRGAKSNFKKKIGPVFHCSRIRSDCPKKILLV